MMAGVQKRKIRWATSILLVMLYFSGLPAQAQYGGGSGTAEDPYLIYTAEQMNAIGANSNDWGKHFKLMADIDLAGYTGTDFNIIGYYTSYDDNKPFTGAFNGNGHTISNFSYASTDTNRTGLFGWVSGFIKDLGLITPHVDAGEASYVGSLVGSLSDGTITDCYTEGGSVEGNWWVGGLVGYNEGTITNCYSTDNVSGTNNIGGLVGLNSGIISNCYASSRVSGEKNVGGLVGHNNDTVKYSFWDIESSGQQFSSGGMGRTTAEMKNASTFIGWGYDPVWTIDEGVDYPKLRWENMPGETITTLYSWGGSGTEADPYLIYTAEQMKAIGANPDDLEKHFKLMADIDLSGFTYATALIAPDADPNDYYSRFQGTSFTGTFDGNGFIVRNLTIRGEGYLGLFGKINGGAEVRDLGIVDGHVVGTRKRIGILVGENDGTLINCYSSGFVSSDDYGAGGLVGYNIGLVTRCYSTAEIHSHHYAGGLIGGNVRDVTNCFSTGTVSGRGDVGGLSGYNYGRINGCYCTGSVTGTTNVGGLVGWNNSGMIQNSYSTGTVREDSTGLGSAANFGGLVGNNDNGSIGYCYSVGKVYGRNSVGGLVGRSDGSVSYCFWDTEITSQWTSAGGTGKTTAEMQTASTFLNAGWDFIDEVENGTEDIWAIIDGEDYPRLWWELLAFSPEPQDGATDVIQPLLLSWAAGRSAIHHDVYLGEDEEAVSNATTESLGIYRGRQVAEMSTYDPGPLELGKTYYWRIDEVDEADPSRPWKGNVWSFTTANFLVVDDFEDYNDYPPDEIFMTWIDGWSDPENGATVCFCDMACWWCSRCNPKPVHGGARSMDIRYDNSGPAYYSEATMTLVYPRDWTEEGVGVLSLWFYGDPNNAPESMYVSIANDNGLTGMVYQDNPNAALIETWTEWTIDLQEFAVQGVNLANVNTISIGFGDKNNIKAGGSGLVFFDDIRLYRHKVIYVDDDATGAHSGMSWANAYLYLQDALADANESQRPVEIRVAQGIYTPDRGNGYVRGDKQAKFLLKSGVTIKGGFAGVSESDPNAWDHQVYKTVLSGDLSGNDERLLPNFVENSDHVIWCIEGDASAVLDGFTITGGYATDRIGGGLLNYKANPIVKRCVFFDNYASQGGGMANRYSSPTVTNCTFDGNLAPYGGGGMYNTDQSHPMVESCVFHDNWTTYLGGGGMYCGDSNPTVINCLFVDNVAPFGGGMYNAAANPFIGNCTFSNNRSNSWGGGMQNEAGARPTVTNCILWGDIPDEIAFSGSATVTYSDVQGAWAGIGNIARNPKFADSERRLSSGSPCIDTGDNDAVPPGITTDLDGNPRFINGTVDMGAYEFGETTPTHPPSPPTDPLSEALDTPLRFTTGGSADWFSQTTTFYNDGDAAQSGDISDDQESWMQTTVSGKGTVKFYWMVSSEDNYDCLEFYIDGVMQEKISGLEDYWVHMTYTISTSGSHTLEWRYMKDGITSFGDDCGWVDKVEWVTTP